MKSTVRALGVLALAVALITAACIPAAAFGQEQGQPLKPPGKGSKAPVQGYTRTNKHTGQPEQVLSHKRRPPKPRPVQVQPYTRGGKPVEGHERRPPAKPAGGGPAEGKKAQSLLPLWVVPRRRAV